ncbi:MAG: putative transposase [Planctomycetota bacterium]|jgi:putative transposase
MSKENPLWGTPHISDELALIGFEACETTVAKYMVKHRPIKPVERWRTFMKNHMKVSAACDFFTVPTATFKVLYVFVVLSHDRRRIEHVNVTGNPTAEWTARQIVEAFPDGEEPRFLHRDRDAIFGSEFRKAIKALGIEEVISARKSPWQKCYAERVIGSLRRECTDHIIPMGERHLLDVLNEYVKYYNECRTQLSLDGNAPEPRRVEGDGDVITTPVLGGLHHRYRRAA